MYSDTELLHCSHKKMHTLVQLTSDKLAIGLVKIIIQNVCISPQNLQKLPAFDAVIFVLQHLSFAFWPMFLGQSLKMF